MDKLLTNTASRELTNQLVLTAYKLCRRKVVDRKHTLMDLSNEEAQLLLNCLNKTFFVANSMHPPTG